MLFNIRLIFKKFPTVFLYVGYVAVFASASEINLTQDTYINALKNSQNKDFEANGGYSYNPPSDIYYPQPNSSPAYGVPPVYGQSPIPTYDAPLPSFYKPPHSIPYHSHNVIFWEKLKSKINLFSFGKILLKLLIFKKIVKFIGLICLLLVLPKLKNLFGENMSVDEEGMNSKHVESDRDKLENYLSDIYTFVVNSIQEFEKNS